MRCSSSCGQQAEIHLAGALISSQSHLVFGLHQTQLQQLVCMLIGSSLWVTSVLLHRLLSLASKQVVVNGALALEASWFRGHTWLAWIPCWAPPPTLSLMSLTLPT